MFTLVSDIAKIQINYIPLPSHEDIQKKWYIQVNNSIQQILESLNASLEEKQSLQKVETLLYSTLEAFQKYASSLRIKEETKNILEKIFEKNQVEQRSDQWYQDMQHMLTASEFSKLFDSPRTRGQMVLSKLQPQEKRGNVHARSTDFLTPMDWGVRFEPVVRDYLEKLWKCKVYESGRLKHPTDLHLGASPDGIIIESEDDARYGRLVEIKCPYSREVGKKLPFEYWCQMQIQMEVTDLNECEYVEVEILSKSPRKMDILFNKDDEVKIMYLLEKDDNYVYSYSEEGKSNLLKHEYILLETIEYVIHKVHNILVKRDSKWYEFSKRLQNDFWNDVDKAKQGQFTLPESTRKRNDECLITDEV